MMADEPDEPIEYDDRFHCQKCGAQMVPRERHTGLVCYVCGGRHGVIFNFCHEHKNEYERLKQAQAQPRWISPQELAQKFHETYERLAPNFGYETRRESAKLWSDVPQQNKDLMIAVCAEIKLWMAGVASGPGEG